MVRNGGAHLLKRQLLGGLTMQIKLSLYARLRQHTGDLQVEVGTPSQKLCGWEKML
jgi:hypothetical protein